jgi:hypothetical protein
VVVEAASAAVEDAEAAGAVAEVVAAAVLAGIGAIRSRKKAA